MEYKGDGICDNVNINAICQYERGNCCDDSLYFEIVILISPHFRHKFQSLCKSNPHIW